MPSRSSQSPPSAPAPPRRGRASVPEAVDDVVQNGRREQPRVRSDVGDLAPDEGGGHLGQLAAVELDRPRVGVELRQEQRQGAPTAARAAHDRHVLVGGDGRAQAVEGGGRAVEHHRGLPHVVRALEIDLAGSARFVERELGAEARGVEAGDDLLVLDPGVLLALEVVDQLTPRLVELTVRLQEGDEGPHVERAGVFDDQPAADHEEEELAELLQEVVDPLDQVLQIVDVEPDPEDPLEETPVPARFVGGGVVGVDLLNAPHRLLDAIRQAADELHAVARERADPPLELADEENLDREENHAEAGHPGVGDDHVADGPDEHGPVEGGGR